jgi:hypothetical protein
MGYRFINRRRRSPWLLLCFMALIGLIGYFGPWVPHNIAGLKVTGIDLGEYVKFVPQNPSEKFTLPREVYYLPLLAGSLLASLIASRRSLPPASRVFLGLSAIPLALAILPPAWSPAQLRLPEFQNQVFSIIFCLLMIPSLLVTRFLPTRLVLGISAILTLAAAVVPAWAFLQVLPEIGDLYRAALPYGWGAIANLIGFTLTALIALAETFRSARL